MHPWMVPLSRVHTGPRMGRGFPKLCTACRQVCDLLHNRSVWHGVHRHVKVFHITSEVIRSTAAQRKSPWVSFWQGTQPVPCAEKTMETVSVPQVVVSTVMVEASQVDCVELLWISFRQHIQHEFCFLQQNETCEVPRCSGQRVFFLHVSCHQMQGQITVNPANPMTSHM